MINYAELLAVYQQAGIRGVIQYIKGSLLVFAIIVGVVFVPMLVLILLAWRGVL